MESTTTARGQVTIDTLRKTATDSILIVVMTLIQKKEWAMILFTASLTACSFGSGLSTGENSGSGSSNSSGGSSSASGNSGASSGIGSSASDGTSAASGGDASGGGLVTLSLSVEPLYAAAPNWNDYVKLVDPASECDGTETVATDCVHGGEARLVRTEETECTGLILSDSEAAFDWSCSVVSGKARFTSNLAIGKGLGHLLDSTSWKSLSVTLQKGAQQIASSPAAWWSNPVQALPDNSATSATPVVQDLAEAGSIYTLATSRATTGYHIGADQVALVVLPGATLSYNGVVTNYAVDGSINTNPACTTFPCFQTVIAIGNNKFAWVEGTLEGSSASLQNTFYANNTKLSRVHRISLSGTTQELRVGAVTALTFSSLNASANAILSIGSNSQRGSVLRDIDLNAGQLGIMGSQVTAENLDTGTLSLSYANRNTIRNARLIGGTTGVYGLRILNLSDQNLFENVIVASQPAGGVQIGSGCDENRFSKININNVNGYAFSLEGTVGTVVESTAISEALVTSSKYGILANYTSNLHVTASTLALQGGSSGGTPFISDHDTGTVFHSTMVTGNKSDAFNFFDASAATLSQLYVDSGTDWSVQAYGTTNGLKLAGTIAGPSPSCGAAASATNLNYSTGIGACTPVTPGEFNTVAGTVTLSDKLSASDSFNASDASSLTPTGSEIEDWSEFENRLRGWGISASLGDDAATGHCTGASNCAIWDWSIRSDDLFLKDRSLSPGTLNAKLSDGSRCPSVENANLTLTTQDGGTTYLRLAFEELGDSVGDDDGLCEASETCIYTPSIGVDQGYSQFEDATFETCSMPASPALAGITLKAYIPE